MNGSKSSIILLGLGVSTSLLVTLGYGNAAAAPVAVIDNAGDGGRLKRERYYVKHDGKIVLFESEEDAIAWVDGLESAKQAAVKKNSRGARKRARVLIDRAIPETAEIIPIGQFERILAMFENPKYLSAGPQIQRGAIDSMMFARVRRAAQENEDIALLLLIQ